MIFALAGSMLCSMTLTPVLASLALRAHEAPRPNRFVGWLEGAYGGILERAMGARGLVLALLALVLCNGVFLTTRLGAEFVPRLQEQAVVINTVRMAGVSLEESARYGTRIERALLAGFPDEIEDIWTRTGTAEVATDAMGTEVSDVFITLKPRERWRRAETQEDLVAALDAALEGMPGMRRVFTQPIEMRVNEMTAGIRADVGIKLFGDELDVLAAEAERVRVMLEGMEGAADVTVEQLTGQGILEVEVDAEDAERAGRHGVEVGEVLGFVESLGPRVIGEVHEGQRRFELALRLEGEATQGGVARLGGLVMRTERGPCCRCRLWRRCGSWRARRRSTGSGRGGACWCRPTCGGATWGASWRSCAGRWARRSGRRVITGSWAVSLNITSGRGRLGLVVPTALLLVLGLLYMTYGRVLDVLRVFTGVPFGMVGGVMALWLRGMPLSISAGVGFVALSGVAVLGDMVLVSRIKQLLAQGLGQEEAIREAARTRLRPVLMTSLVAALGFVPMALNTGVGAEVQWPLATVVIGGMFTSCLATLLVLPLLYSLFGAQADEEAPR